MASTSANYDPVEVSTLSPEHLAAAVEAARAAFAAAGDLAALHAAELAHAGDRSPLALANREIGALPPAARADAGKRIGPARAQVREALAARRVELERERDERVLVEERVDVTLPYDRRPTGARHPITTLSERIGDVFVAMGYEIAEGPELEASWFNFDALNMGPDHPARSMMDTFFVRSGRRRGEGADQGTDPTADPTADPAADPASLVLRTHTSPVQIRTMLARTPPLYVVCPGTVFRTDELDATHSPVFHQVEGLAIDRGLSMADLKGTLDHFAAAMFGPGIVTRLRPSFFPFTEPSAEPDLLCFVCRGESVGDPDRPCRTCGSSGWIEWGGCGMVSPHVLRTCGIDPEEYSGFAFGMGIDRTLMFRNNVSDLRDVFDGDVRFTAAFGMES